MEDDILVRLRALGMSLYEAKVYVGLLQHGPQNGNELAKSAGLPSSKVYSTLERLGSLGIVHSVTRSSGTRWVCISPEDLLKRFRARFTEPLDYLERALPGLASFTPSAEVLTVTGLEAIVENARFIANGATGVIFVSLWPEDLDSMRDVLESAVGRGVNLFGMLYGAEVEPPSGSWLAHSYGEIVSDRLAGRMLTIVADQEEALIAHIPRRGSASGVRTRNPVMALVAQEYLHHDIVLQRAQASIGFDKWDEWWQGDPDLRTIILGSTFGDPQPRSRTRAPARRKESP